MQFKYLLALCFILSFCSTGRAVSACPAPGSADVRGRYSCNPAHQYPDGQTCQLNDGCYLLSGTDGQSTGGQSTGRPVSACPAPGSADVRGRYSCNPAHQYPDGQTCQLNDGCYLLSGTDGQSTGGQSTGRPVSACPAPGSADVRGRYSCNPAHQYPDGQTCQIIDGCYLLSGTGGQ